MGGVWPSGTVTFLFTDIEGSTRLWEEHEPEMRVAVERHDQLVRGVVDDFGGYVFSTAGDAFAVAFGRAGDAVAAAVAAQRVLSGEVWPSSTPVRVRMGVHTGEAQERDGDYFGAVVSRAARIMSAGHGGQVLVSGPTAGIVERQLPAGVRLVDRGAHRLRDLAEPVVLWELAGEGLAEHAGALRVADAVPGNLPTVLTSLVGRDADIDAVEALLDRHRLVTIVGAGGMGKTRLAVHTAAEVAWRFADGVWFVDLLAVGPEGVLAAVAAALQVQFPTGRVEVGALVDAMRGQRLLVVLDNCEHVHREVLVVASRLLGDLEDLVVLATSREPLGVAGEQLYPLGALGPVAAELFVDRARLADPGFDPDDADHIRIARLCERLDGMPLAVELAAGRVRTHSLEELERGLDDRFRLLRGGRRSKPDRHASLLATLEWSYRLLDADEQVVFDRCSAFAGPFTRHDAAGVCGDERLGPADVEDIVVSLVDKSLVGLRSRSGRTSRFELLDTMRAFGQARLDQQGALDVTRARHARWFADRAFELGTSLYGPGETERIAALVASIDDCRAAFGYLRGTDLAAAERLCAGASRGGTMFQGSEPLEWAASIWDPRRPGASTDSHLWYCAAVAWAGVTFHRPDLIEQVNGHLEQLDTDPGHPAVLEARDARLAHWTYSASRDLDPTMTADARRLLADARSTTAPGIFALVCWGVTLVLPPDEALHVLDEAVTRSIHEGTEMFEAAMLALRSPRLDSTDPQRAAADLERAVEIATIVGAPFIANFARDMLIHARASPLTSAERRRAADELLVLFQRMNDRPRIFNTLATIVVLLDQAGQPADIVLLDEAIRHHDAGHGDPRIRRRQARVVERAERQLGPEDTRAARDAGHAASLPDLVAHARRALTTLPDN